MKSIIEVINLKKYYKVGEVEVKAVKDISLTIEQGDFAAIMGFSGSGKSTFMNLLGCLDKPTDGKYFLDGVDTVNLNKNEFANIRNEKIGFVFQGFNLLPRATAFENVELPLLYNRTDKTIDYKKKVEAALERVSLADRAHHSPNQLSGGQQQRVAIARALINNPSIILADEPTGNLDSKTSIEIFKLFQELNDSGITIIMVTHERDFARYAKRIIELRDGLITQNFAVGTRRNANSDLIEFNSIEQSENYLHSTINQEVTNEVE